MQLQPGIHANKCQCGWYFPALSPDVVKCPQCRDEIKYCQKCGEIIFSCDSENYCKICITKKDVYCPACDKEKEDFSKPFCSRCMNIDKKIKRRIMSKRILQIKTFKQTHGSCPYGYDCANCPEPDCILEVDEDDTQIELF